MKTPYVALGSQFIGEDWQTYIIAEISCNHGGDLNTLKQAITAAADNGCRAVKIQTYEPIDLTIDHAGPGFELDKNKWGSSTLWELYEKTQTPFDWHAEIFKHARSRSVLLFSTPFSPRAVDLLEGLGCPAYKIASMELEYTDLLRAVARTGKPLFLSTGCSDLEGITVALRTVEDENASYEKGRNVVLMHCVSKYPTDIYSANVSRLGSLRQALKDDFPDLVYGFSDHSEPGDFLPAQMAVALGASAVERHFSVPSVTTPDAPFSEQPESFHDYVQQIDRAWRAKGWGDITPDASGADSYIDLQRSIHSVVDIKSGDVISKDNVRVIRPRGGLPPCDYNHLVNNKYVLFCAKEDIPRGMPIGYELLHTFTREVL
jgi:N-acetylneuraminate synthase